MYANESYVLGHLSQVLKIRVRNRNVNLYANESQKRLNVRKRVTLVKKEIPTIDIRIFYKLYRYIYNIINII